MDSADDRPLGAHRREATQRELSEAACLFDVPEHRLRQLLAQPPRLACRPALILACIAPTRVGLSAGSVKGGVAAALLLVGAPPDIGAAGAAAASVMPKRQDRSND
jgi:hypothetical protein